MRQGGLERAGEMRGRGERRERGGREGGREGGRRWRSEDSENRRAPSRSQHHHRRRRCHHHHHHHCHHHNHHHHHHAHLAASITSSSSRASKSRHAIITRMFTRHAIMPSSSRASCHHHRGRHAIITGSPPSGPMTPLTPLLEHRKIVRPFSAARSASPRMWRGPTSPQVEEGCSRSSAPPPLACLIYPGWSRSKQTAPVTRPNGASCQGSTAGPACSPASTSGTGNALA
mmetsp:Transcript_3051/g.8604  ORF Transcript_3051/g.8604 Transcript_3051/m.8604 type:complete len:230 (-) Transcript_3051:354-1043(-)